MALAFRTTIDVPKRFSQSATVAPHLGLTPRKYQSVETDRSGRISKFGRDDATFVVRIVDLSARPAETADHLEEWGFEIAERRGIRRARVAVARELILRAWRARGR